MASDSMSHSTRQDDERVLAWLRAARAGMTSLQIAMRHGARAELIRATFQRIRKDDLKFSGEPESVVLAAYPWMRS
jgi:hypothetical protein